MEGLKSYSSGGPWVWFVSIVYVTHTTKTLFIASKTFITITTAETAE